MKAILNSKIYPGIEYEKGSEIYLFPDESGLPFILDISEKLTSDENAMNIVASALDDVDLLVVSSKNFIKAALADEDNEFNGTASLFMDFHRDEFEDELLPDSVNIKTLSSDRITDYLTLKRFECSVDESGDLTYTLDLSLNPEMTDELMVIYMDSQKNIMYISHES